MILMEGTVRAALLLVAIAGTASADPATPAAPAPAPATPAVTVTPAAPPASLMPSSFLLVPPTPRPRVLSMRIDAARVAAEQFQESWRYPEPGPIFGYERGLWFTGAGHYRPKSARSAALHGGSIAATIIGEILMAADSPLAGVGAMLTGATLDAAAAEADGAAEARR
jgi:hypothetical protein